VLIRGAAIITICPVHSPACNPALVEVVHTVRIFVVLVLQEVQEALLEVLVLPRGRHFRNRRVGDLLSGLGAQGSRTQRVARPTETRAAGRRQLLCAAHRQDEPWTGHALGTGGVQRGERPGPTDAATCNAVTRSSWGALAAANTDHLPTTCPFPEDCLPRFQKSRKVAPPADFRHKVQTLPSS
jgi:hypothetical protein